MTHPSCDAQRFTVYRVRFQLLNDADTAATVEPVLQFADGSGDWTPLPMVDPDAGKAFYGASDEGRVFEARLTTIDVVDLRLDQAADPLAKPVPGKSSAGRKLAVVELPAHTFTEVELAVRATVDADWGAHYRFRLANVSDELPAVVRGAGHGRQASPRPVPRAAKGQAGR